jgi:hypothetical protein
LLIRQLITNILSAVLAFLQRLSIKHIRSSKCK